MFSNVTTFFKSYDFPNCVCTRISPTDLPSHPTNSVGYTVTDCLILSVFIIATTAGCSPFCMQIDSVSLYSTLGILQFQNIFDSTAVWLHFDSQHCFSTGLTGALLAEFWWERDGSGEGGTILGEPFLRPLTLTSTFPGPEGCCKESEARPL